MNWTKEIFPPAIPPLRTVRMPPAAGADPGGYRGSDRSRERAGLASWFWLTSIIYKNKNEPPPRPRDPNERDELENVVGETGLEMNKNIAGFSKLE